MDIPWIFSPNASNNNNIPIDSCAQQVPGSPDILIEPFKNSSSSSSSSSSLRLLSSCLFIFPGRASVNAGMKYKQQVQVYMNGLEDSLLRMKHFPGWTFRLYVDYSVYMPHEDSAAAQIAADVQQRLGELCRTYGSVMQTYGCRYMPCIQRHAFPGFKDGATFMPSIWRFIPMTDPNVEIFCSCDLDNPVSSLLLHIVDDWMHRIRKDTNMVFLAFEKYNPSQCAMYVMGHFQTAYTQGDDGGGGYCPIAQFWFWRRSDLWPNSGPSLLARAMALVYDEETRDFFENLDLEWLYRNIGPELSRSVAYTRLMNLTVQEMPSADEMVRELSSALRVVLSPLVHNKTKSKSDSKSKSRSKSKSKSMSESESTNRQMQKHMRWAAQVTAPGAEGLLDFAVLLLCGKLVTKRLEYERTHSSLSALISHNLASERVVAMGDVIARAGYGIDEWIMHAMSQPGHSEIISASTPAAGVSQNMITAHTMSGTPPIVMWLHGFIRIPRGDRAQWARNLYVEFLVRTCVLLRLLQPEPEPEPTRGGKQIALGALNAEYSKMRSNYMNRLIAMLGQDGHVEHLRAIRESIKSQLLRNQGYISAVFRRLVTIKQPQFNRWLTERRCSFNEKNIRFMYHDIEGFHMVKEVFLRACLLDLRMLNLSSHMNLGDFSW